jgi:hypothetical protein
MSTTKADLDEFLRLMDESRKKGYRIGPEVTIGCISVKVSDLRQSKKEGLVAPREMSILEEHGAPMGDDE